MVEVIVELSRDAGNVRFPPILALSAIDALRLFRMGASTEPGQLPAFWFNE
jgi:hypothetical protein